MSEAEPGAGGDDEAFRALKAHADALERQLHEVETRSVVQLRQAELRAEAMRAGIVDIDGLRLLDPEQAAPGMPALPAASDVIGKLRRDKPWLFGGSHSSSAGAAPVAAPVRKRLATDMTIEEWRAARAELLRRR